MPQGNLLQLDDEKRFVSGKLCNAYEEHVIRWVCMRGLILMDADMGVCVCVSARSPTLRITSDWFTLITAHHFQSCKKNHLRDSSDDDYSLIVLVISIESFNNPTHDMSRVRAFT
jgi:hypothetical protein